MFLRWHFSFGFGRDPDDSVVEHPTVVESMGQHEREPMGFSVEDPWEEEEGRKKRR